MITRERWREGKLFVLFLFSYLKRIENIKVKKSREKKQPNKILEREKKEKERVKVAWSKVLKDGQERMANCFFFLV